MSLQATATTRCRTAGGSIVVSVAAGAEGWVAAQEELATLSVNHVHRTVDSSHAGLLEDSGPAAEAVRAIAEVISSVRTGTPLSTR